jgi:multiple sugar transport system permease protein
MTATALVETTSVTLSADNAIPLPRPRGSQRRKGRLPFSPLHLVLMPTAILFAIPLVYMLSSSVMSKEEIIKSRSLPKLLPDGFNLSGYKYVLTKTGFPHWFLNTVQVSAIAVVAHLVLCSLAGYAFARIAFRGRTIAFIAIAATMMIPYPVLMIPTYRLYDRLDFIDTLAAAYVPWMASAVGVFLMRQFFLNLPKELEDAAMMDGCSRLGVFRHVILPLARPALATLALLTLLNSWNDLVWPLLALNSDSSFTLQRGIQSFQSLKKTEYSALMASNAMATIPLVIAFVVAQKKFVETMTFSGLKG